jgi:hypothetical protein
MKVVNVDRLALGHNVLHEAVEQLAAGLDARVRVRGQLGQPVKDAVEEEQDVAARHFADVVQRLARVVAHARVRVSEAREDRRHQLAQIHLHVGVAALAGQLAQRHARRRDAQHAALARIGVGRKHALLAQRRQHRQHLAVVLGGHKTAHQPVWSGGNTLLVGTRNNTRS